jgi:DNA-binding beta-propeller fold protein YncE
VLLAPLLVLAPAPDVAVARVAAPAPLSRVEDVPLPVGSGRFDYADVDPVRKRLVVAHMGADEVLVLDLSNGHLGGRVPGIRSVRGVKVVPGEDLILATAAATDELVRIDARTLAEVGRSRTGRAPDGLDVDPVRRVVAVSDQRDGGISLLADEGRRLGHRLGLGRETGNVAFDPRRGCFWITVVRGSGPDQLVAVTPDADEVVRRIDLPGCRGAHGLRIHPDGRSAFVACEEGDLLLRVDLEHSRTLAREGVGAGPDVLALDPGLGVLYVAAERGDVHVLDVSGPGFRSLGHQDVGPNAHTVAVDPATHRVYFPLAAGPGGGPALRIMRPARGPSLP